MDLFDRQWSTYRAVVDHDLMQHRALTAALTQAVEAWLAARPAGAPLPRMVDLGCGDLAVMAPLLRRLPLGSYLGLDLSAAVLPRAAAALGPVAYPCRWREQDLLAWAEGEPADGPVDLLHSAFAIHHLADGDKARFLQRCRRRLAPGGLLLWADVFREPGENRAAYLARYSERVRGWSPLEPEQQEAVIAHLSQFDVPADREAIVREAEAAGWHWRWVWQGSHRAEALALLTPAHQLASPLA
jgi:SAM-dependent methyltransferase